MAKKVKKLFQHTAARRRLEPLICCPKSASEVSTHSRPKAAGPCFITSATARNCFNTQPPEGGWAVLQRRAFQAARFNTQPPEGGWNNELGEARVFFVSTHSRPKAAGLWRYRFRIDGKVSTHSRPKAAGWRASFKVVDNMVSTHSRPKAAGEVLGYITKEELVSTHSRPKAAGTIQDALNYRNQGFNTQPPEGGWVFL